MLTSMLLAPLMVMAVAPAPAQEACQGRRAPGSVRLDLVATGLRSSAGEVAFSVYPDDSNRFLASRAYIARARIKARAPETRACFWLPAGTYAVATYHDENGDRKFNRTLIAPKEGFGFSNDAPTTFSLPRFAQVRFTVPGAGRTMRIQTRYRR